MVTSLLHCTVEGPVADDGVSAFPAILLWLAGGVSWEVAAAGLGDCGGRSRARPAAGRVALRRGPAPVLAPFPGKGELVRVVGACRSVGGGLRSGASLVNVRLDIVPLPSRSCSPTVTGCLLGGYPAGRDWLGGELDVGRVLPRINIGADVWGESSIMTGVYERWCSSTLHIGWGLCDCLCLVLVCRGRYGLGGGFFTSFWDRVWVE